MKVKFLAINTGSKDFELGDKLTLKQDFVDKRQIFTSDLSEDFKSLDLLYSKEDGFTPVKEMLKFAKDKKVDSFYLEDLKYVVFTVTEVRGKEVVIEATLPTLFRAFKVKTTKSLGKMGSNVSLEDIAESTNNILFKELQKNLKLYLDRFEALVVSVDGKELLVNIDKLNEDKNFFDAKYKEFTKVQKEKLLDSSINYAGIYYTDKLFSKGDILLYNDLKDSEYGLVYVKKDKETIPKELKVLTDVSYVLGRKCYLVGNI